MEMIFPLEEKWVLTPFRSRKTLSDESMDRGLVRAYMHSIARTQMILDHPFMPYTDECRQQNHIQHTLSTKTECDYLNGWIIKKKQKKTVTYARFLPQIVKPRDRAGNAEEEEEEGKASHFISAGISLREKQSKEVGDLIMFCLIRIPLELILNNSFSSKRMNERLIS